MFDVGDSLREAFDAARERLHAAQLAVAQAGASAGRSSDAAMAATARAAIFSEALLGAERARFEELKGVTR
jgi:hypothetical protein